MKYYTVVSGDREDAFLTLEAAKLEAMRLAEALAGWDGAASVHVEDEEGRRYGTAKAITQVSWEEML